MVAALISVRLLHIPLAGPYVTVPIYLLSGYFTAYVAARKHLEILREGREQDQWVGYLDDGKMIFSRVVSWPHRTRSEWGT